MFVERLEPIGRSMSMGSEPSVMLDPSIRGGYIGATMTRASLQALSAVQRKAALVLLVAAGVVSSSTGCRTDEAPTSNTRSCPDHVMTVKYIEIVTNEVESTCALYERVHGVSFGPRDASLGQARVAQKSDGTLIGVREPLADHESPTMRAYLAVEDIDGAVKVAEEGGATIAYPPTKQGEHGSFAIIIKDDVQHGLWQP